CLGSLIVLVVLDANIGSGLVALIDAVSDSGGMSWQASDASQGGSAFSLASLLLLKRAPPRLVFRLTGRFLRYRRAQSAKPMPNSEMRFRITTIPESMSLLEA